MKNTALKYLHLGALVAVAQFATTAAFAQTPKPVAPPAVAPGADPAPAPTPEQIGHEFGLTFGAQMHNVGISSSDISVEAVARGIQEGLAGKTPTPADQQQIQTFVRGVHDKQVSRNEAAAKSYLERNGKNKNVVTTASGLQYKINTPGDKNAAAISPTDEVTVDYSGKLIDGSEFDSSYSRGVPTSFPVNGVIKGWQEALVLMKPGAKWTLYIPPELAYGSSPQPKIPAGSLLIFDVTMISVKSGNTPAPAFTPRPTPQQR